MKVEVDLEGTPVEIVIKYRGKELVVIESASRKNLHGICITAKNGCDQIERERERIDTDKWRILYLTTQ